MARPWPRFVHRPSAVVRRLPSAVFVMLLVAIAITLTAHGTALAQQAPLLTSVWVPEVPIDPEDAAWRRAPRIEVPLTPQALALPRLTQLSVARVAVRSLNDGQRIALRLEWDDLTHDVRATRPDEFRDAAALLFPVGGALPNICMGAPGQLTNLWHWKADWQEDIDRGFQEVPDAYPNFYKDSYPFVTGQPPFRAPADFAAPEARLYSPGLAAGNPLSQPDRASPVEVLVASGFGTAAHKPGQQVGGHGAWSGGRWRVVFVRHLVAGDAESANLAGRAEAPVAFAVWNGSNQEVGARKQLSSFVTMRIRGAPRAARPIDLRALSPGPSAPSVLAVAATLLLLGGAALAGIWLRRRAIMRGQQTRRPPAED